MFIMTNKEHKTGLLLDEYQGKLGILYGFQKGDKLMPFWVYRQSPFKKAPVDKAMPHKVALGTPQQAKVILQKFIEAIDAEYLDKKEEK